MEEPGLADYVKHFTQMAKGEIPIKDFYVVRKGTTPRGLGSDSIITVSPTVGRGDDDRIMKDIPNSLRHKARVLLNHMDDTLTWNRKGEIAYEGQTIRGSYIGDLIEDAVRVYSDDTPKGTDVFYEALAEMGIPSKLIYNKERLLEMEQYRRRGPPGKRTRYY